METILYYSTNTKIAYEIAERFFDNQHYVWCAPEFDINPPSSNPKELFIRLRDDVEKSDNHSSKIRENKAGLLKAILWKKNKGLITEKIYLEIAKTIKKANINQFKPLIYLIPASNVSEFIIPQVQEKANVFSSEYIIEKLDRSKFHVIEL
jgi:hypothetical protein